MGHPQPKHRTPPGVLTEVPELEWCCGSLCDKEKLVNQVTGLVQRVWELELALKQLNPNHELLCNQMKSKT